MTRARPAIEFAPVDLRLRGGRRVAVRAVCPEDADRLQAAVRGLSDESRHARFMAFLRELSPQLLHQATHPAATSELQLVVVAGEGAEERIVAGARYAAAPGSTECEFAIAVVDEWQGLGLARPLLEALMRNARAHGFQRMEGYILATNTRMLGLAKRLGFVTVASPDDPSVRRVHCVLQDQRQPHHGRKP